MFASSSASRTCRWERLRASWRQNWRKLRVDETAPARTNMWRAASLQAVSSFLKGRTCGKDC